MKNTQEEIKFKTINIQSEQDPTDFFQYCIKNKLYKDEKEEKYFMSHMKVIFDNRRERFTGCIAVIAYEKNKPIGMIYVQKMKDSLPMIKSAYEVYLESNLENLTKSRFLKKDKNISPYPIHLGGLLYQDNRTRVDIWRQKCDFQFLHTGFMMMYVKPKHRGKKIISKMIELSELKIVEDIKDNFNLLPDIVKNYSKKTFITITAKSDALKILKNKEDNFNINPIENVPSVNNFRSNISKLSYDIFYDKSLTNNNLDFLLKKLKEKQDLLNNCESLSFDQFNIVKETESKQIKPRARVAL